MVTIACLDDSTESIGLSKLLLKSLGYEAKCVDCGIYTGQSIMYPHDFLIVPVLQFASLRHRAQLIREWIRDAKSYFQDTLIE